MSKQRHERKSNIFHPLSVWSYVKNQASSLHTKNKGLFPSLPKYYLQEFLSLLSFLLFPFLSDIAKFWVCWALGTLVMPNERSPVISLLLIYSGTCPNKLVEWSIASADFWSSWTTHQKVWPVVTILDPARVITWQSPEKPEKLWWHHMPRTWNFGNPLKGQPQLLCAIWEMKMNWLKSTWGIMLVTFVIHSWFHVPFFSLKKKGVNLHLVVFS